MIERYGILKIGDQDVTIIGEDIQIGQVAPDFVVQAQDWSLVRGLEDTQGKVRILAAVPSLDTPVCDRETRRFNQEAASLDKDIVIEVISTDLPFAQKRWCGAAGVEQVMVLSDHLYVEFGQKYGCLIKERRILRRAVFVVNRQGIVTYVAYMPALGVEPNYDEVLQAAQEALRQ
ncbi:MAG: thiol peroxidase [Anaerolineales bacterium]